MFTLLLIIKDKFSSMELCCHVYLPSLADLHATTTWFIVCASGQQSHILVKAFPHFCMFDLVVKVLLKYLTVRLKMFFGKTF